MIITHFSICCLPEDNSSSYGLTTTKECYGIHEGWGIARLKQKPIAFSTKRNNALISTLGNSASTDSIHEAKERSYPWTNNIQKNIIIFPYVASLRTTPLSHTVLLLLKSVTVYMKGGALQTRQKKSQCGMMNDGSLSNFVTFCTLVVRPHCSPLYNAHSFVL